MMISSETVLSGRLKPLCARHNHVMKYERGGSRANTGHLASYHCGSAGCSVRYNSTAGYYTLIGMPGQVYAIDEPGINTLKCPTHDRWLYRRKNIGGELGVHWACSVEDCRYGEIVNPKRA